MISLPSSWKVIAFTFNLIVGLGVSQLVGAVMDRDTFKVWEKIVVAFTMWMLSFIMINVGYEFTIDKSSLSEYGWDYLIAMTAAGFPWIFCAGWFMIGIGNLDFSMALLIARFAAPTSAGILFSMLEAAGLKETWLFSKARILAIFDDIDTILLMIPLKIILVGFKWELLVVIAMMVILLALAWTLLHSLRLPHAWYWTLLYAALVAAFCKLLHHFTEHSQEMEAIHLEVLLPAFVLGCVIDTPEARHELKLQRQASEKKRLHRMSTICSLDSVKIAPEETQDVSKSEAQKAPHAGERTHSKHSVVSNASIVSQVLPPGWVIHDDEAVCTENNGSLHDFAVATLIVQQAKIHPDVLGSVEEPQGQSQEHDTGPKDGPWASVVGQNPADGEAPEKQPEHPESGVDLIAQTCVSLVFMVLVGLTMPALFGENAEEGGDEMPALPLIGNIIMTSILMVLGKMLPVFCYRDEASFHERLALCLGMCPRGEVGASIIVISLELGVRGPAVLVSMGALAANLILSGGFIAAVKLLLKSSAKA